MPEELTTRDVFQQVDARLTRVEDDLRQLRLETRSGFDHTARSDQTNSRFDQIDARFEKIDVRFDQTDARIDLTNSRFDQLQWRVTGLFVFTWVTVIGSIWLKP